MNILMIGNGFDLAHGLPTKYTDFLEFVEAIRQVIIMKPEDDLNTIKWKNISPKIKEIIVATKCDIIFQKEPDDVRGKKDLARKIINLVKIIGRDELIRRTGGEAKTIVFCLQQDMK